MSEREEPRVASLQGFCDLLEKSAEHLRAGSRALESGAEALQELERRTAQGGGLAADIAEERAGVEAAQAQASTALQSLGRAASAIAGGDGNALEDAESAFAHAQSEAEAELETAGGRLLAEGHHALAAAVEDLAEHARRLMPQTQAVAPALAEGLAILRAEAARAAADVEQALEQGRARVQAASDAFSHEAGGAAERWARELARLKKGCEEIGADLADIYADWGLANEREAEALMGEATDASQEAADVVGTDSVMQLEAAVRGALGEPLATLREALAEADAVITAVASTAWELEGLVPQLAICMNVVENINRLLEEMG